MISVTQALDQLFALTSLMDIEEVALTEASGRVLARPVAARLTQPPFAASAMDGYAVHIEEVVPGAQFTVIGESAAGAGFDGAVNSGQAARIFTGAPVPRGATRVVLQEDITRDGDVITLGDTLDRGPNIRPAGADFLKGQEIAAPKLLSPADVALIASMNVARVPVYRKPIVAIISTGDELVQPGETPGPDQIVASNTYGLAAMLDQMGAKPRLLPIARDTRESLEFVFDLAKGADLILTIGGASVGDYDLVGQVAGELGLERSFYKIAIRPGKPLMAGRMHDAMMIGLPGNPVSAMVCGEVFVAPVIRAMLGLGHAAAQRQSAQLLSPVGQNGPREHYMRAKVTPEGLHIFDKQDSALLTVLAEANCLAVRPPNDPERAAGECVEFVRI